MANIIPFDYNSKQVRTIIKDGEPWFVAKDVCDILEISNGRDAVLALFITQLVHSSSWKMQFPKGADEKIFLIKL
ncbi:MAG: hypothetical protein GX892_15765 [Thermoanaerobacteraceae bacterium]|nr:hypothetical protein [Thermoanaerobacteraceae bacterium]